MNAPSPNDISAARATAELTQSQSAELVYVTLRAWQLWEAGDRSMQPGLFQLFQLKTGQITLKQARNTL